MSASSEQTPAAPRPPVSGRTALSDAFALTAAVSALEDLGVLASLAEGALTLDEVVRTTGIDRRLLVATLDGLVGAGVVQQAGAGFSIDQSTRGYIQRSRELWTGFGDALRTGERRMAADRVDTAKAAYPSIAPFLAAQFGAAAPALAAAIAPPPAARVLDAGAGTASWSTPFAENDPACRVTAVDLEPVLAVAADSVRKAGVADQYELVAADLHDLQLEGRFDVVIVAAVLHLFDPVVAAALLDRLARHLAPGGRLAVVDTIVPAGEPVSASVSLYALSLTYRTEAGGLFSFATCASWMRSAGLSSIRQVVLPIEPLSAVIGQLTA